VTISVNGTPVDDLRQLEEESVLKGTMIFCGAFCHVFFIRVHDFEEGSGVFQKAVRDPLYRLEDVCRLDEGISAFSTVTVPGFEGEYVVYLHPGER
jgi:hypothetical protein